MLNRWRKVLANVNPGASYNPNDRSQYGGGKSSQPKAITDCLITWFSAMNHCMARAGNGSIYDGSHIDTFPVFAVLVVYHS